MIGDMRTGYILVPHSAQLHAELDTRCLKTGRKPSEWVRKFRLRCVPEPDCRVRTAVK